MDLKALTDGIEVLKESQSGWASRCLWVYTAFSVVAFGFIMNATDGGLQWRVFALWGGVTAVYIAAQKVHDIAIEIAKMKIVGEVPPEPATPPVTP
jgi:hypothetical protein